MRGEEGRDGRACVEVSGDVVIVQLGVRERESLKISCTGKAEELLIDETEEREDELVGEGGRGGRSCRTVCGLEGSRERR